MIYLIIGLSGICGALLRYAAGLLVIHSGMASIWATLPVNLAGSFLLGAFTCYAEKTENRVHPYVKGAVATGFLGAFTTFSTFSVEAMMLLRDGMVTSAVLYVLASLLGGLGAAWMGWSLFSLRSPYHGQGGPPS